MTNVPVKHFILLLCLCLFWKKGIAQVFPNIDDQPRWWVNTWSFQQYIDAEEMWCGSEDIEIEGKKWIPVTKVAHWNPDSPISPGNTPDTSVVGYYHVNGSKVYYRNSIALDIPPNLYKEGLLYDFSLEKGDSIYALGPINAQEDSVLYKVLEVDSFYCEGQIKRRLEVEFQYGPFNSGIHHWTHWISGIGDIHHPFIPSICLNQNCEVVYLDQTFYLGEDSINVTVDSLPCIVINNIKRIKKQEPKETIKAYPNPVKHGEKVKLQISLKRQSEVSQIFILSIKGDLIHKVNSYPNKAFIECSTKQWMPGVYWVISLDRSGNFLGKTSLVVVD